MRGEHATASFSPVAFGGSSPHARGAQPSRSSFKGLTGIIPACAGSTRCHGALRASCGDHPRMRGEHGRPADCGYVPSGSSPHARGARVELAAARGKSGIIPACAGSTRRYARDGGGVEDHPRMRGEHSETLLKSLPKVGSSPHARGALVVSTGTMGQRGIIPACAGSTATRSWGSPRCWDHPRMRGEHAPVGPVGPVGLGSSPHARGARRKYCRKR